jgi:hypothetical protein
MNIPEEIIAEFKKELEDLKYFGKVTLSVVCRGSHCHFELEKHRSIFIEGEVKNNNEIKTSFDVKNK